MEILENILSQEVVQKLGWTLLHSLWQGGVVVLLLVVCLSVLRKSSANLRYVITCLGLAVIVLLPVVTFCVVPAPDSTSDLESIPASPVMVTGQLHEVYVADVLLQGGEADMQMFPAISFRQRAKNLCTTALPSIVFGWFIGVFALSLWHMGGWAHLQRLKRKNLKHINASLKDKLGILAERLKVTRPVKLMKSALVQIPTVVGCLRPVILLPACALTGLSSGQLEAVLAHELAHIYRYDYLVNMLQTVVEIVGFYHPAVWWISHKMRIERENCCDDLAVSVCGDKVGYARALTSMEEIRAAQGELVIAASGGNLFTRISRLVGNESAGKARPGWAPVVLSALLIIALAIPTTLALTATDSGSGLRADSLTTHVSELLVDEENINSSIAAQPASHLPGTDTKIQILFDCRLYELAADLEIIEGRHEEKPLKGRIAWLGNEYAERLESLSQKTKKAKLLASPWILALEGEEASMDIVHEIPYKAGYESTTEIGTEPKPIVKYTFDGIKLKLKGHTVDSSTIRTELRFTQSKTSLITHKDSQGREIQVPVVASSVCTTDVTVPSQTPVVIGGLKSQDNNNSQLFFVITPSIMNPEKSIESQVTIAKERHTIDDDPVRIVEDFVAAATEGKHISPLKAVKEQADELRELLDGQVFSVTDYSTENNTALVIYKVEKVDHGKEVHRQLIFRLVKENGNWLIDDIDFDSLGGVEEELTRFQKEMPEAKSVELQSLEWVKTGPQPQLERDEVRLRYKKQEKALEQQTAELQQLQIDVQRQLEDLEKRKTELENLSTALASVKEAESGHGLLGIATKYAERDDFAKAVEYLEKAVGFSKSKKYYGIGVAIEKSDNFIRINNVYPGTPAAASPLQPDDVIVAIDGQTTKGMSTDEAAHKITGQNKTKVILTIKHKESDTAEDITLTREISISLIPPNYKRHFEAYKAGKTVDKYREMTEATKATPALSAIRIFALKYANAEELAHVLNRIVERRWKGIKDKPAQVVRIQPVPDANRLIVIASPADLQLIEALIAELDVLAEQDSISLRITPCIEPKSDTPAESTVTEIIALKYADCESTEEKLMILFPDEQFRIVSDKRTNTLIIAGTKSAIEEIKNLIAEIDVPGIDSDIEVIDPMKLK
ncbi:MAG: PDZ domain-containing protein [Planctomycetes bacterium]|nr:PDZ domain-containing protein [Planctomycetota bacterium]